MEKRYRFVGGSQDGNEVPMGDPQPTPGYRLPLPVFRHPEHTEMYELGADGCFHFVGFVKTFDHKKLEALHDQLKPIMIRLSKALDELDALCPADEGFLPPFQIGDKWVLTRRLDP
jgi:hypothetical protein